MNWYEIREIIEKGLSGPIKSTELCFHFINEKTSFQLKLLLKGNYCETIFKAKELVLMHYRAEKTEQISQLISNPNQDHLTQLKIAVKQVSQQMAVLGTNISTLARCKCFACG